MSDEMFFSGDMRSLRRGKRVAPRTDTCRPCLVWHENAPETQYYGVVLDINPHGMRVRMIDALPIGSDIVVQMMRDDEYRFPFSHPHKARVVRHQEEVAGMLDHGLRIEQKPVRRFVSMPVQAPKKPAASPRQRIRMHTLDVTVGGRRRGRSGR
ncbi:MAG: hypothetical protein GWP08_05295 [Nitrospiraceae bacterium]|nr:hypothetical protein [Nitrospiraceae bacterium]